MGGQVAPVRPSNWRQDHWSHKFSSSTNQPRPNPLSAPVRPCLAPPAKRRKQRLVSWLHENLVHVLWLHFGNRTSDPSHLRSVQLMLPLQDWSSSTHKWSSLCSARVSLSDPMISGTCVWGAWCRLWMGSSASGHTIPYSVHNGVVLVAGVL